MNNRIRYSLVVAAFFVNALSCSDSAQPDFVVGKIIKAGYLHKIHTNLNVHEQKAVNNEQEKWSFFDKALENYMNDSGIESSASVDQKLLFIDDKRCALVMQHPMPRYIPRIVVAESSK